MALDKGPSVTQRYVSLGYIKSVSNGYVWTEKGIQFINDTFAELYNINSNDVFIDESVNDSRPSENSSSIQPEQD